MPSTQNLIVVSFLLLSLAFNAVIADVDEKAPIIKFPKKNIVLEGMVYCQSCKKLETWSLSEGEPIPLARISVTCTNHKNRVFYYNEYTANEDGYFYAKLEGFMMAHYLLDHPLTSCKAKLVSSAIESCDIHTNVNNGIIGASLRYEHKRLITKDYDTVFYAAGPLAFRPAGCDTDGTHY